MATHHPPPDPGLRELHPVPPPSRIFDPSELEVDVPEGPDWDPANDDLLL